MSLTDFRNFLSVNDVAKALGYRDYWVRQLAREGKIPAIKRRKGWFFDPRVIQKLLTPNVSQKKEKATNGDEFDLG
jgi:response regulator RpfG family c-di-GMP phosphodiesterase